MKFLFSKTGADRKARAQFAAQVKFSALEAADNKERVLNGTAIVFNQLTSDDRGGYRVQIAPGAVEWAEPVLAYLNHNRDMLIGSSANGSMKFTETANGVEVAITLPNTVDGDRAWEWVKSGLATGMSFGCWPLEWTDEVKAGQNGEQGETICTYTKMLVDEVTITPTPSFTAATVAVASQDTPADPPKDDTVDGGDTPDNYSRRVELMQFNSRLRDLA